jgi:transaldolase
MHLYLDTAIVDEIREIAAWGILSGVTTNPSLVAGSGRKFEDVIREIVSIVDGPVSAEVTALETPEMIAQGRELRKIHPNVVVKLPTTPAGLAACKVLSGEGHPVNMTLVFSAVQALLTARAGATLIQDIRTILDMHDLPTQIIAASIRHPVHVLHAAKAGAHIGTMPAKIFQMLVKHPLTDAGLEKFMADAKKFV